MEMIEKQQYVYGNGIFYSLCVVKEKALYGNRPG